MTDDPLANLRQLFRVYCKGTGMMELVMADQSREPRCSPITPCMYCEAGARIRDERDAARQSQPAAQSDKDRGTDS
jgi:hypothetical protein